MLATGRNARQRPAPPTPKSCSDQPKALWLATYANRIRVSLTNVVARGAGSVAQTHPVSISVRPIFCAQSALQNSETPHAFRSFAKIVKNLLRRRLASHLRCSRRLVTIHIGV